MIGMAGHGGVPGSIVQSLMKEPLEEHPLYEKIRTIGRGQRSFVQVALNKATGEQVAIKFIPRGWEPGHTKYVTREILNHQELSLSKHPHVVEFKEVFLTARYLAEVLEYVEGETLQVFLEKVGGKVIEGLARFIFQQLIIALDFCHRKGKVNRDIKLSNILLSIAEGQLPLVKLCDFGFSKDTYRHSEPHSQVGTALFVAPEVMQNFSGGRYDGQAADVWACGVCLFIMLFGRHPYLRPEDAKLNEQQQMIKLFQRMMGNQIEFPLELAGGLSAECLDLLGRMLKTDPNQRYTMGDIQRHIWFTTALPEGAGLMNDMFLAEDAALLSPQSQSQIEALVALAAKLEDMAPTRVQLPSQAARVAAGNLQQQQSQLHLAGLQAGAGRGSALSQGGVSSGGLSQGGAGQGGATSMGTRPPMPMQAQTMSAGPQLNSHNSHNSGGHMSAGAIPLLHQRNSVNTPVQGSSPANYPGQYMDPNQQQHLQAGVGSLPYPGQYGSQYTTEVPIPNQHLQHQQAQPQQQYYSPPQQPNSHMSTHPYMANEADAALLQHQQQQQQQMNQQQQRNQQLNTEPAPGGAMGMIPDLDAMIMSMPETDLLQAATIDLRPYQQQGAAAVGQGHPGDQQYQQPMPPPNRHPMQLQQQAQLNNARQQFNSISSRAPGSVISLPSTTLGFAGSQNLDGSFNLPPNSGGTSQGLVDAAPFLYEGNDDDLPMVGSVSAVIPKFDWGSFNAPLLANHDTLLNSNQFQISRFTKICRDVSAKLSESGRSSTPGSQTLSPDSLQQQLSGMAMGNRGPSLNHSLSGLSRMMQ